MKKFLLSSLSAFIYLLLFLALFLYLMNEYETMSEKKTTTSKPQPESTIELPSLPKEPDLIHVNFDERLLALNAKVGDPVFVRIFKKESLLEVWIRPEDEYVLFKQYPICAFSGDLGPKLKEGDRQSPEGFYEVGKHQLNPNSKFHLSFNLGFPNAYDKAHHRTGSYLMVHGNCVSIGCYAMTDEKIEEIYRLVEQSLENGQPYVQVHAFPFQMTQANMASYEDNLWYDFWTELKEGYDYFEAEHLPPHVKVEEKHYTVYETKE